MDCEGDDIQKEPSKQEQQPEEVDPSPSLERRESGAGGATEEIEWLRHKVEALQREWDCQQEHLGRVQAELCRVRNQLQNQSAFCSSLGAVMGHLIWKASRLQPVVDLLLSTNKVNEFLSMATSTLVSFMETYSRDIPDIKSEETQFIVSMGGVVANIAATPQGRQFVISDPDGKMLVDNIVKVMPIIPPTSGDPVKRILMMVLYNLSLNQNGMLMIQDRKPLLIALSRTVLCDRSPELRIMALRLLDSITTEIPSLNTLNLITHFVPRNKLQTLYDSGDAEIRHYTGNILANLVKAEKSDFNISSCPNVCFEECSLNNT